jgi:uncharacterized PurR-regulated membrane protein YhhQ (DUF165 family)
MMFLACGLGILQAHFSDRASRPQYVFIIALVPNLLSIVLSAIAINWVIAVLDTPFLYLARQIRENANN